MSETPEAGSDEPSAELCTEAMKQARAAVFVAERFYHALAAACLRDPNVGLMACHMIQVSIAAEVVAKGCETPESMEDYFRFLAEGSAKEVVAQLARRSGQEPKH